MLRMAIVRAITFVLLKATLKVIPSLGPEEMKEDQLWGFWRTNFGGFGGPTLGALEVEGYGNRGYGVRQRHLRCPCGGEVGLGSEGPRGGWMLRGLRKMPGSLSRGLKGYQVGLGFDIR